MSRVFSFREMERLFVVRVESVGSVVTSLFDSSLWMRGAGV